MTTEGVTRDRKSSFFKEDKRKYRRGYTASPDPFLPLDTALEVDRLDVWVSKMQNQPTGRP